MSVQQRAPGQRRGGVLIIALLFIVMFSALAAAVAAFSGINVRLGDNQRRLGNTRACAESGLEVTRYWLSQVAFSGTTPAANRFATLATNLQSVLTDAGVTNIVLACDATTITVSNVPLNSAKQQFFSAVLTKIDTENVRMEVTGHNGSLDRTIRSSLVFDERAHTVFDYGLASKGRMKLSGNIEMLGANIDVESNAYIDTDDWVAMEIIGNSSIAGTVKITNPNGSVDLQGGQASIGGQTGLAATQPPCTQKGAPKTEFPEMVPSSFEQYVTSTLDPATNTSSNLVLENVRIPPNMNPNFTGGVTIRGVLYIEAPNVVKFAGTTNVCGVIVGNGDPMDHSGTNKITFTGNLTSIAMDDPSQPLPEPQFDGIRNETGTFLMAPGFAADFEGPFETVSGAIAANGITFGGSAGGTIDGSLINYSPSIMSCSGKNDLFFNRTGTNNKVPAGFVPQTILRYDSSSYSEVL
jgi:Tfp pilus assembly protein PilX